MKDEIVEWSINQTFHFSLKVFVFLVQQKNQTAVHSYDLPLSASALEAKGTILSVSSALRTVCSSFATSSS